MGRSVSPKLLSYIVQKIVSIQSQFLDSSRNPNALFGAVSLHLLHPNDMENDLFVRHDLAGWKDFWVQCNLGLPQGGIKQGSLDG